MPLNVTFGKLSAVLLESFLIAHVASWSSPFGEKWLNILSIGREFNPGPGDSAVVECRSRVFKALSLSLAPHEFDFCDHKEPDLSLGAPEHPQIQF